MNKSLSIAIGAALLAIVVKLSIFSIYGSETPYDEYPRYGYLLIVLGAVYFGIVAFKKQVNAPTPFLEDAKEGTKTGAIFALLMAAFSYIYYSFIDKAYFANKIAEKVRLASEQLDEKGIKAVTGSSEVIFSAFFHSTITLMGFLFLSIIYSLILTFLIRKIPQY